MGDAVVGSGVGVSVGSFVGVRVGGDVGSGVGGLVGSFVGVFVGAVVGWSVDGFGDGVSKNSADGIVEKDGATDGTWPSLCVMGGEALGGEALGGAASGRAVVGGGATLVRAPPWIASEMIATKTTKKMAMIAMMHLLCCSQQLGVILTAM